MKDNDFQVNISQCDNDIPEIATSVGSRKMINLEENTSNMIISDNFPFLGAITHLKHLYLRY